MPLRGLRTVARSLQIAALLLCTATIGSASSNAGLQLFGSRTHSVASKQPHGGALSGVRFLTDGVRTVEIPAGSLLSLPKGGRIRMVEGFVGKRVDWVDFFKANSDELRQVGVSRKQLRGQGGIHPSVSGHLLRIGKVGIAIAAGRPVALPRPS